MAPAVVLGLRQGLMPPHSYRGREGEACLCPVCLALSRIGDLCLAPGLPPGYWDTVLHKLRGLQGELLDLYEFSRRAVASGAPPPEGVQSTPPVPGGGVGGTTPERSVGGGAAPESAPTPVAKEAEQKAPKEAKKKPDEKPEGESRRGDRKRRDSSRRRSSRTRHHKRDREEKTPKEKRRSKSRSRRRRTGRDSPSKQREIRDPRGEREGEGGSPRVPEEKADPGLGAVKEEELASEGEEEEALSESPEKEKAFNAEEVAHRASAPKSRPQKGKPLVVAPSWKTESGEPGKAEDKERGEAASGSRRDRAPRSPRRSPDRRRQEKRSDWGHRTGQEAKREKKNKGLKKRQRNAEIRTHGWEAFHASKRR